VILALATILTAGLLAEGSWWAFLGLLVAILAANLASNLGLAFSLRRSYIVFPFLLAALAVPFTMPGEVLFRVPWLGWAVSEPGVIRLLSILARSWLAVQAVILLMATTRFPDLNWALGALRLPMALVSTVAFMHRYLYLVADEALRMIRARASRSPESKGLRAPGLVWRARVSGGMVGSLFLRSLERAERVYAAMLSRGYDGRMLSFRGHPLGKVDWVALLLSLSLLSSLALAASWK
jgi:cobalt/nickel transport system permease protein